MVKTFTKFLRFDLTPELSEKIRAEAKRRKVSVSALIRTAVEQYLSNPSIWIRPKYNSNVDAPKPIQSDQEYAHEVLMEHFAEDRNEIIRPRY